LLPFHRKGSNSFLGDFLVSFCETLLCVERLACIFEMFGPINMISHEHRRKETTNGGLSAGRRCRGSYFPVWCSHFRSPHLVFQDDLLPCSLHCFKVNCIHNMFPTPSCKVAKHTFTLTVVLVRMATFFLFIHIAMVLPCQSPNSNQQLFQRCSSPLSFPEQCN
jgi:hypothetical protein